MRKVIDLNYLRTSALETYLKGNGMGVLFEFHFKEMSKGNSTKNMCKSLAIVGKYSDQMLICKPLNEIILLTGMGRVTDPNGLIESGATERFGTFCRHICTLSSEGRSDAAFDELAANAKEFFLHNETGARQVATYIKQTLTRKLSTIEIKELRKTHTIADNQRAWILEEATTLSSSLLAERSYAVPHIEECIGYRYILAGYLLCMYWLSSGGLDSLPISSLVNDITDMMYVALSTYFDGILTKERKVNWVYEQTMMLIEK